MLTSYKCNNCSSRTQLRRRRQLRQSTLCRTRRLLRAPAPQRHRPARTFKAGRELIFKRRSSIVKFKVDINWLQSLQSVENNCFHHLSMDRTFQSTNFFKLRLFTAQPTAMLSNSSVKFFCGKRELICVSIWSLSWKNSTCLSGQSFAFLWIDKRTSCERYNPLRCRGLNLIICNQPRMKSHFAMSRPRQRERASKRLIAEHFN